MRVYDGDPQGATDDAPEQVLVGIAEYDVAAGEAVLSSSGLGSCVGVAVYDPVVGVAGLLHAMLPERPEPGADPAKYVDSGLGRTVDAVLEHGGDPNRLRAKVAGGSDMLNFEGDGSGIGSRNVAQCRETLAALEVPIAATDVGGEYGRSLELSAATGELTVTGPNREATTL